MKGEHNHHTHNHHQNNSHNTNNNNIHTSKHTLVTSSNMNVASERKLSSSQSAALSAHLQSFVNRLATPKKKENNQHQQGSVSGPQAAGHAGHKDTNGADLAAGDMNVSSSITHHSHLHPHPHPNRASTPQPVESSSNTNNDNNCATSLTSGISSGTSSGVSISKKVTHQIFICPIKRFIPVVDIR